MKHAWQSVLKAAKTLYAQGEIILSPAGAGAGGTRGLAVLQVFASTLVIELAGAGRLYRIGGDEFIVLTNALSEDELHELVDIALLVAKQVAPVRGVSMGVAHSLETEGTALIALADTRMYEVKRRRQTLRTAPLNA